MSSKCSLSPQVSPPKPCIRRFSLPPMRATCPAPIHFFSIFFSPHNNWVKNYRLLSSSLCSFLHSPCYLVFLRPKYSPQHPILNTPLNVSDQVSHPYKTTGKIIVLYILTFKNILHRKQHNTNFIYFIHCLTSVLLIYPILTIIRYANTKSSHEEDI